ncbi:MAG: TlpA disulfide reductase family protein [Rhizomicrobium sp.]
MDMRFRAAFLLLFLFYPFSLSASSTRADALNLSAYKGKVVYLDFWASWCIPCRLSFPWMNDLQNTLGNRGFVVVAVDVDHDRELADEFLQANDAQFRIVYDPEGAIARKYNFRDMPTSILIGRDGKIRSVHNGFFPNREGSYLSDIYTLLDEGTH